MLPLQSNSYVEATSVSADFVVIDTSAILHKEAAYIFTTYACQTYSIPMEAETPKMYVNTNLAVNVDYTTAAKGIKLH